MFNISYSLPTLEEAVKTDIIFGGEISVIAKEWPYSLQKVCLIYMMLGEREQIEECLRLAVVKGNFLFAYIWAQVLQEKNYKKSVYELMKLAK